MADIELVIKIPEKLACEGFERPFTEEEKNVLIKAIGNGTPLPKGHGRLVDMSEVLIKLMQFYDGDKTIGQCLDEVNTIIEADKGRK
jgi:hypothetical protein